MDLDIQVQKLKMLKSNFLSEKYGLEDKVIKFYPQQIAYLKSRVEGLTKDVETAKLPVSYTHLDVYKRQPCSTA